VNKSQDLRNSRRKNKTSHEGSQDNWHSCVPGSTDTGQSCVKICWHSRHTGSQIIGLQDSIFINREQRSSASFPWQTPACVMAWMMIHCNQCHYLLPSCPAACCCFGQAVLADQHGRMAAGTVFHSVGPASAAAALVQDLGPACAESWPTRFPGRSRIELE
jgi:hypothetical protein